MQSVNKTLRNSPFLQSGITAAHKFRSKNAKKLKHAKWPTWCSHSRPKSYQPLKKMFQFLIANYHSVFLWWPRQRTTFEVRFFQVFWRLIKYLLVEVTRAVCKTSSKLNHVTKSAEPKFVDLYWHYFYNSTFRLWPFSALRSCSFCSELKASQRAYNYYLSTL